LLATDHWPLLLNRHRSDFFFHLNRVDHNDGVPGAAVEEAAVRTFAEALLAADAKNGIDRDTPEWCAVFIRHPEHAVFDGTIFHASRRPGASRAALGNDRQFLWLLLSRRGKAFGSRFGLHLVWNHADSFGGAGCRRHVAIITCFSCKPKFPAEGDVEERPLQRRVRQSESTGLHPPPVPERISTENKISRNLRDVFLPVY